MWFLISALLLAFVSCRKEKDTQHPVISVLAPSSAITVTSSDSVLLIAEIADENRIESVRVVLVNNERISIAKPVVYYPASPSYRVEQYIMIEDYLFSGDYFILINAFDGTNAKLEYVPLKIDKADDENIQGFLIIEDMGAFQTRLTYTDPEFVKDTTLTLPGKYHTSGVNNAYDQLYMVTPEPSRLYAFPLREAEALWSKESLPPYSFFSGLYVDSDLLLGTYNGDIFVYDHTGAVRVNTLPVEGRKAGKVTANEMFIVCGMSSLDESDQFLYVYYRNTGGLRQSRLVGGKVQAIVSMGEMFLIGIQNGTDSEIYTLEPTEGILTFQKALPGVSVLGLSRINASKVLVNTGDKIYTYDMHYNTLSMLFHATATEAIYEPVNSIIYLYNAGGVEAYSYPEVYFLTRQPFDFPIMNFHIITQN